MSRKPTPRKAHQDKTAEWRNRYEAAITATGQICYEWDTRDNSITYGGPLERILGYQPEEMAADLPSFLDLVHPDDVKILGRELARFLETRAAFKLEYRLRHKNGTYVPLRDEGHFFAGADGAAPSMVGFLADITERKQAEEAARESDRRLASMVSNLPGYVYRVANDPSYTPEFISESVVAVTGYTQHEYLVDRTISCGDEIHAEDRERVWQAVQQAIAERQSYEVEYRIHPKSGGLRWVWERGRGTFSPSGELLTLEGFVTDITERTLNRVALSEFKRTLDQTLDSVFMFRLDDLRFIYVNEGARQQVGYTEAELLGMTPLDIKPEFTPVSFRQELRPLVDGTLPSLSFETIHRHKDGHDFPVEVFLQFERHQGLESRFVAIVRDISERKRNEAERQRLEAQLRQSQKMEAVGQLAGGVAHDFNNLLTVISTSVDLARANLEQGTGILDLLEEIREAGNRAADLTRQLLAFSRKQIVSLEVVNLGRLLADLGPMLRRLIRADIELVIDPGPGESRVRADLGQITQVVMNLVINSRDAMPTGGKLTIALRDFMLHPALAAQYPGMSPGPYAMLVARDTGGGMDEATRSRVFEPFFTTKVQGHGTGLGLSVVYGIVKQMGGGIYVDSAVGSGTTFTLYLPQTQVEVQEAPSAPGPVVRIGDETILLVDDEPAVVRVAQRALKQAGYSVLEARSGAEALDLLQRHAGPVHLLLTDVVMPGRSGPDLAAAIKDTHPETRVMYTSGYTDDAILRLAVLDKAAHFIGKPYTVAELTTRVRQVLDQPGRPSQPPLA